VDEDDGKHKKDVKLSVDPLDSDTLIVDLHDSRSVKPGTEIRVELFNLNNPVAGNYAIDVTTIGKKGNVLEVIPPIAYSNCELEAVARQGLPSVSSMPTARWRARWMIPAAAGRRRISRSRT